MRSRPTGYRDRLSGLIIVAMLAGCTQHSAQDSDVTQAGMSSDDIPGADALFDQANTDARSGLSALDLERLGLGNYWNTLDANGDAQVSRKEFRKRFDDPALQRRLYNRGPGSEEATSEQAVSSSWHLPPASPAQGWRRTDSASAPATLSAPVEPATSADNTGNSETSG